MTYKEILNDEPVINKLKQIDLENENGYNHGLNHALNVIEIIEDLSKLLKIDETSKQYLLIACVLHDVGMKEGKENHAKRSATFAKEYLKNKIPDDWYSKVVKAINSHHEKIGIDNLDIFSHILLFADKMDFSRKRLNFNYIKENNLHMFEEHILNVTFKISDGEFIININTDKNYGQEEFDNWAYFLKLNKRMEEFSRKINKKLTIKFD